jgi:hypothetical protein
LLFESKAIFSSAGLESGHGAQESKLGALFVNALLDVLPPVAGSEIRLAE